MVLADSQASTQSLYTSTASDKSVDKQNLMRVNTLMKGLTVYGSLEILQAHSAGYESCIPLTIPAGHSRDPFFHKRSLNRHLQFDFAGLLVVTERAGELGV